MTKYKTYRAHIGFYDTIVAAPSMKAAVEAWHASAKIFKLGTAEEVTEKALAAIATSKPRVVFKRLSGRKDKFEPDPQWPKLV